MKILASNLNRTIFALSFALLAGCENTVDITSVKESGTANGSGSSAVANSETSVLLTPPAGSSWKDFTVDLGSDFLDTNICSGKSIFGRSGSALCGGSVWTVSTLGLNSTNVGTISGSVYTYSAAANIAHNVINVDMGADYLAGNICSTKSILTLAGTAVCLQGSTVVPANASNILFNKDAWLADGTIVTGTMPNNGTWDVRTAFPGAGYVAGVSNAPTAAKICSSATGGQDVLGVSGTGVCLGASGGTNSAASDVLAGTYF